MTGIKYRCQERDGSNRQCVLMAQHVDKVPCNFTPIHCRPSPSPESVAAAASALKGRKMNKTETRYASMLEGRRIAGELLRYEYEAVTFKLADDCRYTPDFFVITQAGGVEFHEVKGAHIWEDARVKIRVAARNFDCFTFYMAQYKAGEWNIGEINK
jgi:hypothetical protein